MTNPVGGEASPELLVDVMSNGTMATLIILACGPSEVIPDDRRKNRWRFR